MKKTVEHFLQGTTSEQNFFQELARRGIRIEQGQGDIYYQDGKGKPISSQKLGERYSAGGLSEQIRGNQVEQSSRQSYERIMAGSSPISKVAPHRCRLTWKTWGKTILG
ncbi:hypothetical protein [Dyadobacter sandarakinus]|uniref:Uncharacterized protein n=1 Tax=Dyadobacter sandarakinus TaxID=2747268 RepID=A0ABX7IB30_9BACT|nr:hypothetical protein [Dyadobacter sandarakinus]QRR03185.1 hypothetical protein HWI92_20845 [Dyadobacter sandarakinus]